MLSSEYHTTRPLSADADTWQRLTESANAATVMEAITVRRRFGRIDRVVTEMVIRTKRQHERPLTVEARRNLWATYNSMGVNHSGDTDRLLCFLAWCWNSAPIYTRQYEQLLAFYGVFHSDVVDRPDLD
jgi:hypothetical protein